MCESALSKFGFARRSTVATRMEMIPRFLKQKHQANAHIENREVVSREKMQPPARRPHTDHLLAARRRRARRVSETTSSLLEHVLPELLASNSHALAVQSWTTSDGFGKVGHS